MAHPLTQHPPSALPFGAASRPSPLSYAFGYAAPSSFASSSSSAASTPTMSGNAFTSLTMPAPTPPVPAFGKSPLRPSTLHVNSLPSSAPQFSLKRARRSPSPMRSSSPSPTNSVLPSPRSAYRRLSLKGKEREDVLRVASLDIGEDDRMASPKRTTKRLRKDAQSVQPDKASEDMDVGVLLATLPSSSHLQILLSLLRDDPALKSSVLAKLPEPDLSDCIREIHKSLDSVKRTYGNSVRAASGTTDQLRAWNRAQDAVQAFCRSATTYLQFFHVPPAAPPHPHPSTSQGLLLTLTKSIITLLPLVPSEGPIDASTDHPLLNLAKSLLNHWTVWLNLLSEEINKRGEMYPHSIVSGWMDALDGLVVSTSPNSLASSWESVVDAARHPLIIAFNEALVPLRDRFVQELGWLIGRRLIMA